MEIRTNWLDCFVGTFEPGQDLGVVGGVAVVIEHLGAVDHPGLPIGTEGKKVLILGQKASVGRVDIGPNPGGGQFRAQEFFAERSAFFRERIPGAGPISESGSFGGDEAIEDRRGHVDRDACCVGQGVSISKSL